MKKVTYLLLAAALCSPAVFAADAAATYKAKCAGCHGADGAGGTPMGKKLNLRDLRSADVQKQTDDQLQTIISKGKAPMPAGEKSMDADQIKAMVAYVRGMKQ